MDVTAKKTYRFRWGNGKLHDVVSDTFKFAAEQFQEKFGFWPDADFVDLEIIKGAE